MLHLSTPEVVLSIENTPVTKFKGFVYQEYNNFFGKTFILPDLQDRSFDKLEMQEHLPRIKLDYQDNLMKQLNIFFMRKNITDALTKMFETTLKFDSADIWIDDKDYNLSPHTDDSRIKLALQIYLGDDNIGTSLYTNNENVKTFEYKFNSGYALLNNDKSFHGLDKPVQKSGRTSLYVRYS
jgi:hypothetical protein